MWKTESTSAVVLPLYVHFSCSCLKVSVLFFFFFFQAEDGIRDVERSRGLGDVYKRQVSTQSTWGIRLPEFEGFITKTTYCEPKQNFILKFPKFITDDLHAFKMWLTYNQELMTIAENFQHYFQTLFQCIRRDIMSARKHYTCWFPVGIGAYQFQLVIGFVHVQRFIFPV
eukprot:TRINITY_DN6283_c0_g1_i6.p3 TRINITY_DN6283_c0_g1~~TRINITY_DN6283_c0_g1_i6.p3  ORF type:complete len:170 (+),score=24.94 TRINITY_DN6283_c0_g1_i6:38-547(+)